jgi:acyl-CoA thioester hydrolase
MSYRFHCQQVVRWKDIDSWGVLNNAVYLTLLEQARYEYCRELGILVDGQIRFVLAEVRVRFAAPGRMGSTLDVAARTTGMRRSSFTMTYEVRDAGHLLVEAEAVLVWVDEELRPEAIPDPVRTAISAYENIPARA